MRQPGRPRLPRHAMWALAALAVFALATTPACAKRKARRAAKAQAAAQPAVVDPQHASQLRERALEVLEYAAREPDPAVRANALEGLALAPTRAEPAVAAGLRDSNEGVRFVAAMVVGKAALRRLAPALRPLVNDPSPNVRAAAIFGLDKSGVGADPTPLASMLLSDPSPRVRCNVVYILGELGQPSAAPMIRQAAASPMTRAAPIEAQIFQLQAAEALVKLGDEASVDSIRSALFPPTPADLEATALAAQILGNLGRPIAIPDLNNLAGETDRTGRPMPAEVRLAAVAALAKLGRPQGVAFIADQYIVDPAQVLRAQAALVYGELKDPANLAKLEPLLADGSGLVRVSAAAAILKITGRS